MAVEFVKKFVLTFVTLLHYTTPILAGCPTSWYDTGLYGLPGCFTMMKNKNDTVPWSYAKAKCQEMDGRARLPIFNNPEHVAKFKLVSGYLSSSLGSSVTLWLGGYQTVPGGSWVWLDNSTVSGSWQSGQPDGSTSELCIGFNLGAGDTGYSDFPCSSHFAYVCQITENAQSAVAKDNKDDKLYPGTATCDSPWVMAGGNCYQVPSSITQPTTTDAAQQACTSLDEKATLPQFHSAKDWDAFIRYVGNNVTSAEHRNILLGASLTSGSFAFTDGTWHFSYWGANQPDNANGNENCLAAIDTTGYTWNDIDCSTEGIAICQLSFSPSDTPPADDGSNSGPSCPTNWVDTSPFSIPGCVLMEAVSPDNVTTSNGSWGYAESVCQKTDPRAHLAILSDTSQFSNFKMAMSASPNKTGIGWFGAFQPANASGTWMWLNGVAMTGPWATKQPNGSGNCVGFSSKDNGFSSVPCGIQAVFACQITDLSAPSAKATNVDENVDTSNPNCPSPWVQVGGNCYQLPSNTQPTDSTTATSTCASMSGTLPVFKNGKDWDLFIQYVSQNLSTFDHQNIHIGAKRSDGGSSFVNTADGSWSFSNWLTGQPDNNGGSENCVVCNDLSGYGWNDVDCSVTGVALCQYNPAAAAAQTTTTTTVAPPPSDNAAPPPSDNAAPPPSDNAAPPPSDNAAPPPSDDAAPPPSDSAAPPPSDDAAPAPAEK